MSSNLRRCKLSEQSFKISFFFVVVVVVVVVPSRVAPNPPPRRELKNDSCASMSLVMIKTATAVHIYMGNTTTTNVKRKDERSDDGKKKALLEKKKSVEKIFYGRGKRKFENAARLPRKRRTSLQKSLASLALLFLSLNTRNKFKEYNKISMIGNYLSTMLVCVFAYLYPLFLCFKVRERTI